MNTKTRYSNRSTIVDYGDYYKSITFVILFGCTINLLHLVMPLYMLQVFDRVLASYRGETLLVLSIMAGIALIAMGFLETIRARILNRMGNWLDQTLSDDVIEASIETKLSGMEASAQPLRDVILIRNFISNGFKAILDLPWTPLFIVALFFLHFWLGLFAVGSAFILLILTMLNERLSRKSTHAAISMRLANEARIETGIKNADVLKAMGMTRRFIKAYSEQNRQILSLDTDASDKSAAVHGLTRFVRMSAQIGILGLGALLIIEGQMSAGGMIAGSILLARALAPIEQVMSGWRSWVAAQSAKRRLFQVLRHKRTDVPLMSLPEPLGKVDCEGVWALHTHGEEPVLRNISFSLEPGQILALMGPSASGKTSLCKILVGSWRPAKGAVQIDKARIDQYSHEQLGHHIGYLPQDIELFPASVRDNIARLSSAPDARSVVEAAKAAGVHEMILNLPQGYDTILDPSGVCLSGGQRQRIGLARALFGNPRLIVLDEPSSNLDAVGEVALIRALQHAKQWQSTVIMVTHDARLLGSVDKIMVLKAGQLVMFETKDKVLQKIRSQPAILANTEPARLAV